MQLGYVWINEDDFISTSANTSESKNISVTYHYDLTKNQSLKSGYSLTNGGEPTGSTTDSENESLHLTYNYCF